MAPKTPEPPCPPPGSHKMITATDGVPGEARTVSSDSYGHVPEPSPEESSRKEPPRVWPAARRQQSRTEHERHTTSRASPSGYGYVPTATYGVMPPKTYGVVPPKDRSAARAKTAVYGRMPVSSGTSEPRPAQGTTQQPRPATAPIRTTAPTTTATAGPGPGPAAGPGTDAPSPKQEWWERLRDRTSRSRIFLVLRRRSAPHWGHGSAACGWWCAGSPWRGPRLSPGR